MTRPYAPRAPGPLSEPDERHAGRLATSRSINAIIDPLAYLAAYVVPVHSVRPSERPCDGADEASTLQPYLPTHGAYGTSGAVTGWVAALGVDAQHAQAVAVLSGRIVGAAGFEVDGRPLDMPIMQRVTDPGDVLDPLALSILYPENGPFGFSCRDLGQTWDVAANAVGVEADAESATDAELSAAVALAHVASQSVYGLSYDAGAHTGDLDWDEWPAASPVLYPCGSWAQIREAHILTGVVRDVAALDRMVYAREGAVLASSSPSRSFVAAATWSFLARGIYHYAPTDRLPADALGDPYLAFAIRSARCTYAIGVRTVTPGGTYGQTSTLGSWVWTTGTQTTGTLTWQSLAAELPGGLSPGGMYEIAVAIKRDSGTDGEAAEWLVYEPAMFTAEPD